MDFFFRLIAHDLTVWLFCGVLVLVFLYGTIKTYILRSWFIRIFGEASEPILRLSPEPAPQDFYDHYDEVNREISSKCELSSIWREFSESVFLDDDRRHVCLSARPQVYFQKPIVSSYRLNLKQLQAFPNYLVGLGLFFTFLGLAAALHIAQADLASESGEGQKALFTLLEVASLKFISSMTAISLSLALSFIQRSVFAKCQKTISNFCSLLEERTEFIPAVKIMSRSLTEQKQQTAFQADMALNISVKLGEILAKSLPESVANALQPLAEEIRGLASRFSDSNEGALQNVLSEFLSQLRQSSGQDMDALVSSVRTVNDSLTTLVENLRGFSSNFGSDTQASTERLTDCMRQLASNFEPVYQGIGQFGSTLQKLETIAVQIHEAGGSISGAAHTNRDTSQSLADTLGNMSGQIAPLQTALTQLQEGMSAVAKSAQSIEQVSANMNNASQELRQSATEIGSSQRLLADKLHNFGQAAETIGSTVVTLKTASQQVGQALEPLRAASTGVIETASAIKETERRIQEAQTQLLQAQSNVQSTLEKIPAVLAKYEERFGKVDEEMARAFEKLAEGSGQFQASVQGFVMELDKNFTQAVSGLSGAVQEMTEEREEFFAEKSRLS